jgi:hypothetical protein
MAVRRPDRHTARVQPSTSRPRAATMLAAGLVAALLGVLAPAGGSGASAGIAIARAAEFPAGYEGFHTYAEMSADVAAVAAAHPDIVQRFSIGTSDRGRTLWAAKISDNVATDEAEPEVLFDGLHHGDEHMSLEMTLRILHWLADGYGTDSRITRIVDTREIWIVFAVNPDGAETDIAGGRFRHWRKNRQPNADGSIGTDLNRNYNVRWSGEGTASARPSSLTYRGPAPFSAPETRAMRDFLASRVVDGRQQIRAAMTFHEFGRLVMWPFGYTRADLAGGMTPNDHSALVAIGRHIAATNGYTPQQASDLYITTGTSRDYMFATYRIFVYTVELSAIDYPKAWRIAGETGRNREAVLYLAERAWCPLGVLGTTVRNARCGAFDDDLEVARGWTVNPDGTDTAPASGRWVRGDPATTTSGGRVVQQGTVPSGLRALVTGAPAGSSAAACDLDGVTVIRSAPIALPAALGQRLTFRWLFGQVAGASADDHLRAIVEAQDGTRAVAWERVGTSAAFTGSWRSAAVSLDPWAGTTIRILFEAADGGRATTVEAGIDDVRVTRPGG